MITRAGLGLALLGAALLVACRSSTQEVVTPAAPRPETPAPTSPAADASGAFTWTETPTIAAIPATPVAGQANGSEFVARFICFQPGLSGWEMVIADKEFEQPTDIITDCQSVKIDLPEEPRTGWKHERAMGWGGGYWQIRQIEDPSNTTSWNADNAWAIEITSWEAAPYDSKGEMFQVAGRASGKVAVCYKAGAGFANSWVAGTFKDAPIRYMGAPPEK